MTVMVSKDKSTIIFPPKGRVNENNPSAYIVWAISLHAESGSQKLKDEFLVIATHGSSDGREMETGLHADMFKNTKEIEECLQGRSILYISCWGGELGAAAASREFPETPVVACGSGIYAKVNRKPFSMTLTADPDMKDPLTGKPESGANRYKGWVIAHRGLVTEYKVAGMVFQEQFFINQCRRLKRSRGPLRR